MFSPQTKCAATPGIASIPSVDLPDARGWFKMVTLAEISGRLFLREGTSHSEALRRLLGAFSALGMEIEDSSYCRAQWKDGSWEAGAPVLLLRASDARRGEDQIWSKFFIEHPLDLPVRLECSLRESRDD